MIERFFREDQEFRIDPDTPNDLDPNPEIPHQNAFTRNQKLAIHVRDGHKCNFPDHLKGKGECNYQKRHEVHHIKPQGYLRKFGVNPDFKENGIDLCGNAHDLIHPDTAKARKHYKPKGDSFLKVQEERAKKLDHNEIYWNATWDRAMEVIAVKNTQEAENKGWVWPEGREEEIEENDLLVLDKLRERLEEIKGNKIIQLAVGAD